MSGVPAVTSYTYRVITTTQSSFYYHLLLNFIIFTSEVNGVDFQRVRIQLQQGSSYLGMDKVGMYIGYELEEEMRKMKKKNQLSRRGYNHYEAETAWRVKIWLLVDIFEGTRGIEACSSHCTSTEMSRYSFWGIKKGMEDGRH